MKLSLMPRIQKDRRFITEIVQSEEENGTKAKNSIELSEKVHLTLWHLHTFDLMAIARLWLCEFLFHIQNKLVLCECGSMCVRVSSQIFNRFSSSFFLRLRPHVLKLIPAWTLSQCVCMFFSFSTYTFCSTMHIHEGERLNH